MRRELDYLHSVVAGAMLLMYTYVCVDHLIIYVGRVFACDADVYTSIRPCLAIDVISIQFNFILS